MHALPLSGLRAPPALRAIGSLLLAAAMSCGSGGGGALASPALDPQSAKLQLGLRLMFDGDLSRPPGVACGTCHDPQRGWADGRPEGKGIQDNSLDTPGHDPALAIAGPRWKTRLTGRNTPSIYNSFLYPNLYWDGRAGDLVHQANFPPEDPLQMNSDWDAHVLPLLEADPAYAVLFALAFEDTQITRARAVEALGAYEATIAVFDTPFDAFLGGDAAALSASELRGHDLFFGAAGCGACHTAPMLTDTGFHNTGVPTAGTFALDGEIDLGRGKFTDLSPMPGAPGFPVDVPADYAKFRTPQLRMVGLTAPYMHNGALLTLEEVVEFYDQGGGPDLSGTGTKSALIVPLGLQAADKADLVAFLRTGLAGTEIK